MIDISDIETAIQNKCHEMAGFVMLKNRSYGNSVGAPLGVFARRLDPMAQIDVRIDDKLSRLARGTEYHGDDTIKDLAGYLILRMVMSELAEVEDD